jgi:hypothetical protein
MIHSAKFWMKVGAPFLAVGVLVFALAGCSDNQPLSPAADQPNGLKAVASVESQFGADPLSAVPDSGTGQSGLAKGEGFIVCYLASDTDSAEIGDDGGEINLCLDEETSKLVIPKDALEQEVYIKAKAAVFGTPFGLVRMYDFQPEGLQFQVPATLYLSTTLPLNAVIRLLYFNPLTGQWEIEQAASVDSNGVAVFQLNHFSKYAIT